MKKYAYIFISLVITSFCISCTQPDSPAPKFTLSLNSSGGSVTPSSLEVTQGSAIGDLPIPTKSGFTCSAWQIDGKTITKDTVWNYTENKIAMAVWIENVKYVTATLSGTEITIEEDKDATADTGEQLKDAISAYNAQKGTITKVTIVPPENGARITPETDISSLFSGFAILNTIEGLENIDTSEVITMGDMFNGCNSLTSIEGLKNWETSNVKSIGAMFYLCSALTNIDALSNWDTSSILDMHCLFDSCSSLTSIDALKNWDTSSVTSMYYLLYGCSSLTNIDALSNWNTSSVDFLNYAFSECTLLESIVALKNWDTSSVYHINSMFEGCTKLEYLDISGDGWNDTKVTSEDSVKDMFKDCPALTEAGVKVGPNITGLVKDAIEAIDLP